VKASKLTTRMKSLKIIYTFC